MKIVLAGTPTFSINTFQKIIQKFNVVGIISQPNRPIGRKKIVTDTPVAELAKQYEKIKLFQPEKIGDIFEELKQLDFDVLITMAYGQIIPKKVLDLAKIDSFNIHASLLPKYRGSSPIQYAIMNGDKETGITFMKMNEKMDAGDIVFTESLVISEDDTYESLLNKLSTLSSEKVEEWLKLIETGDYSTFSQDEEQATYTKKITKEDERLTYTTIEKSLRLIKALSPNPGVYTILNNQNQFQQLNNKRIKIFNASKNYIPNAIHIECSDGYIYAFDYQFEGKNRVTLNIKNSKG